MGKIKAFYGSDAAGITNEKETIYPIGDDDFAKFQRSLAKLNQYEVEILCVARKGVFLGRMGGNLSQRRYVRPSN